MGTDSDGSAVCEGRASKQGTRCCTYLYPTASRGTLQIRAASLVSGEPRAGPVSGPRSATEGQREIVLGSASLGLCAFACRSLARDPHEAVLFRNVFCLPASECCGDVAGATTKSESVSGRLGPGSCSPSDGTSGSTASASPGPRGSDCGIAASASTCRDSPSAGAGGSPGTGASGGPSTGSGGSSSAAPGTSAHSRRFAPSNLVSIWHTRPPFTAATEQPVRFDNERSRRPLRWSR
eukprot:scaffold644_cov353-Prasinococcus_capsulatus_cf.AAC.2